MQTLGGVDQVAHVESALEGLLQVFFFLADMTGPVRDGGGVEIQRTAAQFARVHFLRKIERQPAEGCAAGRIVEFAGQQRAKGAKRERGGRRKSLIQRELNQFCNDARIQRRL
jgi:hypothetical protein